MLDAAETEPTKTTSFSPGNLRLLSRERAPAGKLTSVLGWTGVDWGELGWTGVDWEHLAIAEIKDIKHDEERQDTNCCFSVAAVANSHKLVS